MTNGPVPLCRFFESDPQFGKLLAKVRANQQITEQTRQLLPADMAHHLLAALREGDRLVLFTTSPAWASRLRFAVPALRASLHAEIRDVKIRITPEKRLVHAREGKRLRARLLSPQIADQMRIAASGVSDPQLSEALRRLASHRRTG